MTITVYPNSSPTTGGRTIAISGSGFTGTNAINYVQFVLFYEISSNPNQSVVILVPILTISDSLITVNTPSSTDINYLSIGGTAGIILRNSNFTIVDQYQNFLYFEVTPTFGPPSGGITITIKGGGLNMNVGTPDSTINELKIDNVIISSPNFIYYSSNGTIKFGQITCNVPVHAQGPVDIKIKLNNFYIPNLTEYTYTSAFTYYDPPAITSFTPTKGPISGGTPVTINGTNLGLSGYPNPTVQFGTVNATFIGINPDYTQLTVQSPSNSAQDYIIIVTNILGTGNSGSNKFTYGYPPTISGFSPTEGPRSGQTLVTIDGTYFGTAPDPLPTVKFGNEPATGISRNSNTEITAISPFQNYAGNYIIYVTNDYGTGQSLIPYVYAFPPTITSFSPLGGPVTGGTPVTLNGTDFGTAPDQPTVKFGGINGTDATSISLVSNTQIIATSPFQNFAGNYNIYISSFSGTGLSDPYLYASPPTITSFSPTLGPFSGTQVTINGTNFGPTGFQMPTVKFGGSGGVLATSISRITNSTIIATSPPISQSSILTNTTKDVSIYISSFSGTGLSGTDFGYYKTPALTTISPYEGPISGGTEVEIKGSDFISISTVTIGGVPVGATGFSYTPSTITAKTPANTTGSKDVIVNNGTLKSNIIKYNYLPNVPSIISIDPAFGPTFGEKEITITGTNFTNVLSLTIGGYYAHSITVDPDGTKIIATTPEGNPGNQLVVLSTGNGTVSYPFEYISPAFTLSPSYGPDSGGTVVIINETTLRNEKYLVDVIDISINSTSIEFYYDSGLNTITIITPSNTAGSASVVLTWPNSITVSAIFTYTASPTIISVSPLSGIFLGGTFITITGTNLVNVPGFPLTITIGGILVPSINIDPITGIITCNTPGGTIGAKTLELNTAGGTTFATFTYIGPTITNVYPSRGPTIGGTFITITGTYFSTITAGTIGDNSLTNITLVNNTVTALTPASTSEEIKTLSLTMYDLPIISYYTYDNTPLITIVVPNGGTPNGGTTIQIIGTSFVNPLTVTIGGVQCINPIADQSNTIITTITPAGLIGIRSLVVTTNGKTATSDFNYLMPLPTFPYGNRECAGPPYNATNFTSANTYEYDKLVNYAKNSPNYPFDTGVELQQIYKGQRNVIMFNSLNQKTDAVKNINNDRISKGLLGNIPYPQFKSQTERIMYIQGQTLTAARNRMTGENPTIPMGVPCSTIYEIINS